MLSAGGMIAIAMRHRDECYAFNFAAFMENVQKEGGQLWHQHLREKTFIAIEKVLKALRIWLLRMENLLLRILRRVRGIKEKKSA